MASPYPKDTSPSKRQPLRFWSYFIDLTNHYVGAIVGHKHRATKSDSQSELFGSDRGQMAEEHASYL